LIWRRPRGSHRIHQREFAGKKGQSQKELLGRNDYGGFVGFSGNLEGAAGSHLSRRNTCWSKITQKKGRQSKTSVAETGGQTERSTEKMVSGVQVKSRVKVRIGNVKAEVSEKKCFQKGKEN